VATQDLAAAVSYILGNAATLGVSPSGYSLWGSSTGARMAASIGRTAWRSMEETGTLQNRQPS